MPKIRTAIIGYGNLGHALEQRLTLEKNIDLTCIFSRRKNVLSPLGTPVLDAKNILAYKGKIDILCLATGSASNGYTDALRLAEHFNIITTFDTHAEIPDLFEKLQNVCTQNKTLCIMSVGWDPGLFSCTRATFASILGRPPSCFWGEGISLGHSEAVKRLHGVKDALALTIPSPHELQRARQGKESQEPKHSRLVYVTPEHGANLPAIEKAIKSLKHYFEGCPTTVVFVSPSELEAKKDFSHAGVVIGTSAEREVGASLELSVSMSSNPDFTARIVTSYARVFKKLKTKYSFGALTPLHFSPLDLSADDEITTIKKYC